MGVFIQAAQLIVSLSILVIFHELGHFVFAKIFKTRVEKFYLFFDPWFSLFKYKKGETEYGLGWLPLGGYVKISGMIDESMDKEQLKKPPQPWEFRSKPAWQRLFIMLGGVLVNFLLAGLIYIAMLFSWGEDYLPVESMSYGISVDSVGYEIGFRNGDKIISVNDKKVEKFRRIIPEILLNDPNTVQIERDGRLIELTINGSKLKSLNKRGRKSLITPRFPFVVDTFSENSNAFKSGIKKGDRFIAVNDSPMQFFDEFVGFFQTHKNQEVTVSVIRNYGTIKIPVKINEKGHIGIYPRISISYFNIEHIDYPLFEAIPAGISKGFEQTSDYLKQFKLIFNPETEAYKSLGSFVTIGSLFPKLWDWQSFWSLTALLSIILGVVNVLPIPALDGGHVMFVIFEMVTGKKPSDKFLENAQILGFIILIAIMIFALRNDFINHIFN